MRLLAAGHTDRGLVRKNNEDSFLMAERLGLFAVADGMGGCLAGEIASGMALDVLRDRMTGENAGNGGRLTTAIRQANLALFRAAEGNNEWRGMGSTIAAVLLEKERVRVAHVGDSRVYLIRGNAIRRLTDDHTLVAEQVRMGLISKEAAEVSNLRNIITRALGQEPEVEVDYTETELMCGDRLLLCTDGLTSMVSDDAILSVISSLKKPEAACRRLIDMANAGGGRDNTTLIILHLTEDKPVSLLGAKLRRAWEWFR